MRLRILVLACAGFLAKAQVISTIAGGGPRNLTATLTTIDRLAGLTVDSAGNLYVATDMYAEIWKINPAGQLNRLAGNPSYSPPINQVGPAIDASYSAIGTVAADRFGNLFFKPTSTGISKVDPAGILTTLNFTRQDNSISLGTPSAIAIDSAGNIYLSDRASYTVRKVTPQGVLTIVAGNGMPGNQVSQGDGGPATLASIYPADNLAVDSKGSVYFSDSMTCNLRKVSGGIISTIAGTGSCGYNGSEGPASETQLGKINGLAIDQFDNLYIAESTMVREIQAGQPNITTIAGNPTVGISSDGAFAKSASFGNILYIAVDQAQNLYLYDFVDLRLRKITAGILSTVAGSGRKGDIGEGHLATDALIRPYSLALDGAGSLLFADTVTSSILKIPVTGGTLVKEAGANSSGATSDGDPATGYLNFPRSLVHGAGGTYFTQFSTIWKFANGVFTIVGNLSGMSGYSGDGGPATLAMFNQPAGLALAANGDLYVSDLGRIRVISAQTGIVNTIAGNGKFGMDGDGGLALNALVSPDALALDGTGNLYFSNGLFQIRAIDLKTKIVTTVAGDGTRFAQEGVPATQSGLNTVTGLFGDQSGNLFFADFVNSRIRKIDAQTKIVTTVAGNGIGAFGGDGGAATEASFIPESIVIDGSQNLYIADYSGRIRTSKVKACFFTAAAPPFPANGNGSIVSLAIHATNPDCRYTVTSDSPYVTFTGSTTGVGDGLVMFQLSRNSGVSRTISVSLSGVEIAIAQNARGGQDNIGYFRAVNGPQWALNSSGTGILSSGDRVFPFAGPPGATAVVGDWNGDGHTKVGYCLNGFWVLDYNGNGIFDAGDKFFAYGSPGPGYIPVVGDWDGDGRTKVGFYNNGFWALDTNGNGVLDAADPYFRFGGNGPGEVPLVGDWNGDGRTKVGYFSQGSWTLDLSGKGSLLPGTYLAYGSFNQYSFSTYRQGDVPVLGDWNGDGRTKIGMYRNGSWFLDYNGDGKYDGPLSADKTYNFAGESGDLPIVGDWNGDGRMKIGTYNNGVWTLDFDGDGAFNRGDRGVTYGLPGDQPLIGRW